MNDFQISLVQKYLNGKEFSAFLEKSPKVYVSSPVDFIKTIREFSDYSLKECFEISKHVFPETFFIINVKYHSWEEIVYNVRSIHFSQQEKEDLVNAIHIVWGQTKSEEIKFHLK
jgi:hypothetical protein